MGDGILLDPPWWHADHPEGNRNEKLLAEITRIRSDAGGRRLANETYAAMYGNTASLGYGSMATYTRNVASRGVRLGLNIIRNCTGAVTSKIAAKNEIAPFFDPTDADYEVRRAVERASKYVSGVFYENKFYRKSLTVFRDACVYGTGTWWITEEDGRVKIDRLAPNEIVVDEEVAAACDGQPMEFYITKAIDKEVAKKRWPDFAMEIETASTPPNDIDYQPAFPTKKLVMVSYGWRLPTKPGEKDGRHVVCIPTCDFVDEVWSDPQPLAFFRWSEALTGFFGVGLAEELRGIQDEINKLLRQIARGQHLITGHYLVEQNAKVVTQQINNDIAAIVKYAGVKPDYQAPQIIQAEIYDHLWKLYAKAYEICGISQLAASSQKPPGITAAVALETLNDQQTERFFEVGKTWEGANLDVTDRVMEAMRRIGRPQPVRVISGGMEATRRSEMVDVEDIELTTLSYAARIQSASTLPATPAGKLQWATNLAESGLVQDQEDLLAMTALPDTEAYVRRKLASRRVIERNLAHMIDTGEYVSPEPMDNHEKALVMSREFYHQSVADDVPEAKLDLVRRYMGATVDFMKRIAAGEIDQAGRMVPPSPPAPVLEQPAQDLMAPPVPPAAPGPPLQ